MNEKLARGLDAGNELLGHDKFCGIDFYSKFHGCDVLNHAVLAAVPLEVVSVIQMPK
ncbi:MAG: hypothetical protein QNL91_10050 [Candidatus Krumholzibacteria bacterium]|nr:hypothetical protein [Candidatus Krumholzibacteria bacterium]